MDEVWDIIEWLVGDTMSLRRLFEPPGCYSQIHVLFMQCHIMRNNLWSVVPFILNPLNMLPLFVILISHLTMIPTVVLMLFTWTLDLSNLSKKCKNYRESIENMTSTIIDQFSEFVERHVESIMLVLHEADVRVGPYNTSGLFVK